MLCRRFYSAMETKLDKLPRVNEASSAKDLQKTSDISYGQLFMGARPSMPSTDAFVREAMTTNSSGNTNIIITSTRGNDNDHDLYEDYNFVSAQKTKSVSNTTGTESDRLMTSATAILLTEQQLAMTLGRTVQGVNNKNTRPLSAPSTKKSSTFAATSANHKKSANRKNVNGFDLAEREATVTAIYTAPYMKKNPAIEADFQARLNKMRGTASSKPLPFGPVSKGAEEINRMAKLNEMLEGNVIEKLDTLMNSSK